MGTSLEQDRERLVAAPCCPFCRTRIDAGAEHAGCACGMQWSIEFTIDDQGEMAKWVGRCMGEYADYGVEIKRWLAASTEASPTDAPPTDATPVPQRE